MKFTLCFVFFLISHFQSSLASTILNSSEVNTITGQIELDETWKKSLFISHIPTFEKKYQINRGMIIAEAKIDSLGHFSFNLPYLPDDDNLYRLHIVKKDEMPATLIIGGTNENHIFLCLNKSSRLVLKIHQNSPPFSSAIISGSDKNQQLLEFNKRLIEFDLKSSSSSSAKRSLLEKDFEEYVLNFAETNDNQLLAIYAIDVHRNLFNQNPKLYGKIVAKWDAESTYRSSIVIEKPTRIPIYLYGIIAFIFIGSVVIIFLLKRNNSNTSNSNLYNELTVQERNILRLLKEGKSNKEIAVVMNISVSTVKSHVSSIYSKMNIKSRKELLPST